MPVKFKSQPKSAKALTCSICGQVITRDRYEFALEGSRQDLPCESEWQHLVEVPTQDCCDHCFQTLVRFYRAFRDTLRANRGVLPQT